MAPTFRSTRIAAIAGLGLVALLTLVDRAETDDRDLLRFNSGKPYVFILLDTSASMTLDPTGNWVSANGDDPRSKIYQAKKALYEVFESETDFHLGFATFNQDHLRVQAKHWIYSMDSANSLVALGYPSTGEELTFGAHLPTATPGTAGSCGSPLPFNTARQRISRFPKLGPNSIQNTVIWISNNGKTYRLTHTLQSGLVGQASLGVTFLLEQVASCSPITVAATETKNITFKLKTEFLMRDLVSTTSPVATATQSSNAATEPEAGWWQAWDAISDSSCNTGGPFSGDGWEGNYDSGIVTGDPDFDADVTDEDPFTPVGQPLFKRNLLQPTSLSTFAREVDYGDMIPFHWGLNNADTMLRRLAPNHNDGSGSPPEFRASPFFTNQPNLLTGLLELKDSTKKPIVPAGNASPLSDAIADFRCWYLGQGANKCRDFGAPTGWENVAIGEDTEWGCRRPYLIVVGDGGDNCPGENPCADTANLFSKAGVRSWVITYAQTAQPPLHCIAQNGRGELIFVDNGETLATELRRILGLIREESRAFASAAAPSVQAVVEDKVYVSTFIPINNSSYWDGHLDSFLKPLPLDEAGRPDRTREEFNWDAGAEIRQQAPSMAQALAGTLKLGPLATERRVFYTGLNQGNGGPVEPGEWPAARRLFQWTQDSTDSYIRYDLWEGLEIPYVADNNDDVDQVARLRANQVVSTSLGIKPRTLEDGSMIEILFGDVFHSDPIVVGSPANFRLFAEDAESDGSPCSEGNPSYRCFFRKHQYRRKVVIVGSNDGMYHFFDGGRAEKRTESGVTQIAFFNDATGNGTGRELLAYIPRPVLGTVRRIAEVPAHRFGADGTPVVADVFIDPVFNGTPTALQREFRTVMIAGLREGGSGYLALDLTQPDKLDNDLVPQPINTFVPSCLGSPLAAEPSVNLADCGAVPFASPLWEFNDSVLDNTINEWVALDEDDNDLADLADTWSPPSIGRIQICEGSECDPTAENNAVRDLWVAAFGGGMDPDNKYYHPSAPSPTLRGNWVYMVDIETGRVIYKRQVEGAVPAAVAAVDSNQDGYLDRMYVPTVSGFLYRVDLTLDGDDAPTLTDQQVTGLNDITYTVPRIPQQDSTGSPYWAPYVIFDANFDGVNPVADLPRSLYHEVSVVFVADLGLYAVAFGTGDREDLWAGSDQTGRFYIFVDDTELLGSAALPLTEADLAPILVGADNVQTNLLTTRAVGQRGWFLTLEPAERVITKAFALSGVTFFTAYRPDVQVSSDKDPLCSKTGDSRIFIVNTTNANSLITDLDGIRTRYKNVATFVTPPYTEQGSGRNLTGDGGGGGGGGGSSTADDLTEQLQAIMEELKTLFPDECRFANYRIDIKTIASDTGVVFIAPVPVCLVEKNWKEF